jgi:hypothetical protein
MKFLKAAFVLGLFWLITQAAQAQNPTVRGFYLSDCDIWIGDSIAEDSILWYASGNAFNYMAFYSLGSFDFADPIKKNQLAAFIRRAKTSYGISQVGAIGENSNRFIDDVIPYNSSRTSQLERFDVFNYEFEWWTSSSVANFYCSRYLTPNGYTCDTAGAWAFSWIEFRKIDSLASANGAMSEYYLGWPDQGRMQDVASVADRILLHSYRQDDSDVYSYTRTRLTYAASINRSVKIIPIFCAKPAYMGPWLDTNSVTRPYQTYYADFTADTGAFKQYINLQGYQWFSYTYLPKRIDAVAIITPSGSTNLCQGQTVTLTANQGTAYLWSNGATSRSITVSAAGNYSVRVTNSSGGFANSSPVTVNVSPSFTAPTISAGGPTTFCQGSSVTLTSSSLYKNRWTTGDTSRSIVVNTAGTFNVTVTNGACSMTSSNIVTSVIAPPAPPVISANGPLTFCQGGSVVLTSNYTSSNRWSTGATTQSITVTASGNYTVSQTGANGCSSTSSPTTVSVTSAIPTPTVSASGPTTFCLGGNVILTSSSLSNNTWSNGATTQSITVTASGTYSVTVSNGICPSRTSSGVTVTVNGTAPIVTASGPLSFCQGGSVTLTSNVNSGNRWSNGSNNRSITVNTSGTYTVSVTSSGCTVTSAPSVVTVYSPVTTPTITAGGPLTFCQGGSVTLTSSATTYNRWSNGDTSRTISVTSSGSYSVTVNNGYCPAATSSSVAVTVNPLPAVPIVSASGPLSFCQGGSVVLTSNTSTGIRWSNNATSQSITVNASGSYSVTATTAAGCTAVSSVTAVTVYPSVPVPTIAAGGPLTFCQGGSVVLTSNASTGNSWSNGATTQSITVLSSGSYTVTTSNGYCSATSTATTVTVNPVPATPTVTANGPLSFCSGGNVRLTSSATAGNRWSNSSTSQSITVSSSGTYTVTVTSSGCSATSSPVVVTVFPSVSTPSISASGPLTFCQGGNVTLTSSASSGNVWSNGATTSSINVTASGSYTVTVSNGYCSATSSAKTVTVNPVPAVPVISAGGPTNFCQGGSVLLTSSATSGNVWSNGSTARSITVTVTGNYQVTVTSSGCSATSTAVPVTVNAYPTTPVISANGPLTFCQGGSVALSASSTGNLVWSDGSTATGITVSDSGTYSVTAVGQGNCSVTSAPVNVVVLVAPAPLGISASGPLDFCPGSLVILTADTGPNYLWSNGATTRSVAVSESDTLHVSVVGTNGCTAASSEVITRQLPGLPVAYVLAGGTTQLSFMDPSVTLSASFAGSSILWSNGATTASISVSDPGSYNYTVTDANGCTAVSRPLSVSTRNCSPPRPPTISLSGSNVIISGQSIILTSSNAWGYLWSNGDTTSSITVNSQGTYWVRSYSSPGCYSSPTAVTIYVAPARSLNSRTEETEMTLYPNPARDEFRISFTSAGEIEAAIIVTDMSGRKVLSDRILCRPGRNELRYAMNGWPSGIYFVSLKEAELKRTVRLVVY